MSNKVELNRMYNVQIVSPKGRVENHQQVSGERLANNLKCGGFHYNRFNRFCEILSWEAVPEITAEMVTGHGRWGCE